MPAVSDNPFVIFFFAFIPSALLVSGVALLTGTGLSKSRVESPAVMLTNVAQSSTYIKTVVGPQVSSPDTGIVSAEYRSDAIATGKLSLTSALSRLAEPDPVKTIENVVPGQPTGGGQEGANTGLADNFPSESDSSKLAQTELTPQLAAAEAPAGNRTAHAHQHPQSVSKLLDEQPQPVSRALTTTPTAAPARSASSYNARVWAALARHSPKTAQRGSTTVTFEIGANGELGYVRVSQSSGNAGLDQMALNTVRNSVPFPPPPSGRSSYTIRIDLQ